MGGTWGLGGMGQRKLILSHSRTLTTKTGLVLGDMGGTWGLGGMGQRELGLRGQETDFESLAHPDHKN